MKTIALILFSLLIGVLLGVPVTIVVLYVALHENQQRQVRAQK